MYKQFINSLCYKLTFKNFSQGLLTPKILKAEASRYFLEATLFGAKTLNKDRRVLQEVGFSEASRDNLETASFGNPDSSLRFGAGGERGQWSGTLPAYLSGSSTLLQTQALP